MIINIEGGRLARPIWEVTTSYFHPEAVCSKVCSLHDTEKYMRITKVCISPARCLTGFWYCPKSQSENTTVSEVGFASVFR
jgi:hypothetical protein